MILISGSFPCNNIQKAYSIDHLWLNVGWFMCAHFKVYLGFLKEITHFTEYNRFYKSEYFYITAIMQRFGEDSLQSFINEAPGHSHLTILLRDHDSKQPQLLQPVQSLWRDFCFSVNLCRVNWNEKTTNWASSNPIVQRKHITRSYFTHIYVSYKLLLELFILKTYVHQKSSLTFLSKESFHRCNKLIDLLHFFISNFRIREHLSLQDKH